MNSLKDKSVLVVGLGKSGVAAARFCANHGAKVVACDSKTAAELGDVVNDLPTLGVELSLGQNDEKLAKSCDMIVASPGVSLDLPLISKARGEAIPIIGEMELAVNEIDRPIIAVTGTNGKTTTTALIGHLLKESGISACVAGNIGTPLIECIDEAAKSDRVVLEVSSFQMDTTPSLDADISVWLNVSEDHIDRHRDYESYIASKAKLFSQMGPGGVGIYNACDDLVSKAVIASRAKLIPFDAEGRVLSGENDSCNAASGYARFDEGDLVVQIEGGAKHRYPISESKLIGAHNRENVLAAILAAELAGASYESVRSGVANFRGLPHRMEFVAEVGGTSYYDDSKGTNVGATAKALEGFSEPVVLIAGGLTKGADLSPLAEKVSQKVKRAVLIGEAAEEMEKLFKGSTEIERASSMDEAVMAASRSAASGDVVLLSPACASFDMFRNYNERGDAFKRAVNKLKV